MEGVLQCGKSLLRTGQISILEGPSDGIEIQSPIRSEERVVFAEHIVTQCDQIPVVLLGRGYIARLQGVFQLLHFRTPLAKVFLPEG
jgi:hypothetical protein